MAKTTHNVRQLTITGSTAAMDNIQTSLNDNAVFMMQVSGGSDPVQLIKAQHMQDYFSDIDVDAVSSGEYSLVFIDPAGADSTTSGFDFKRDSEGNSAVSWDASANRLKIVGDLRFDHDGAVMDFGDNQEITLTHVHNDGLLLAGTSGINPGLSFRDSGLKVHSSADGQLDIDSDGAIQMSASTNLDVDVASQIQLSAASGFDIDSAGTFNVDIGSSTNWTTAGGATYYSYLAGTANTSFSDYKIYAGRSGSVVLSAGDSYGDRPTLEIKGAIAGDYIHITGGYLQVNDDSEASSTTTGALRVVGGAGIAKDLYVGDDLRLASDSAVLALGAGNDVTLTHDGGTGATLASAGAFIVDGAAAVTVDSDAALTLGGAGVDIDADGSSKVTIDGAGGIDIGVAADVAIDIDSSTLDIDASSNITIDASGGSISIGTNSSGRAVNIGHATSSVTIGDDLIVTGDLTVNGTNTIVNSTVTTIDDPLIVLGKDNPGTSRDLGLVFEQSGSATNVGFFYDSSATEFALQSGLSEDGTTAGNISLGSYAALHIGALDADSASNIASLKVEDLTSGRVVLAGSGGEIEDSGNLTFDGSQLSITGIVSASSNGALGGTLTVAGDAAFDATGGSTSSPDFSVDGYAKFGGAVELDGKVDLDATGGSTSDPDLHVDGYAKLDGTVEIDGALQVDNASVRFTALDDLTEANIAADDIFLVQDESETGNPVKQITLLDLGQYLADGGSLSNTAGIQVSATSGKLSIDAVRKEFNGSTGLTGSYSSGRAFAFDSAPLDDSIQVFLNGMLQTPSSSSGLGASVFDYVLSGTYGSGGGLQVVFEASVVDANDAVVVHYIKK